MFSPARSAGFSTIECLIALVILSLGVLGSAGTMGLAVRSVHAGAAASAAARLVTSIRDSLALEAGVGCDRVGPGSAQGPTAVRADWRAAATSGGTNVELTVTRPGLGHWATDTLVLFLPCE